MILKTLSKTLILVSLLYVFLNSGRNIYASAVLFQDNFDNDLSQWEKISDTDSSIWSIVSGMVTVQSFGTDITHIVPLAHLWDDTIQNIAIDFDYKYTGGQDQNFMMRYRSNSDHYELHFNGNLTLDRVNPPNSAQLPGYSPPIDTLNHIRIEYRVTNIKVFVDGILKFDYDDVDNTYNSGRIGLRVASGNIIYFDNIVVTSLDPDPTPTASPTPTPSPTPTVSPTPTPSIAPTASPSPTPSGFPKYMQTDPQWKSDIYDNAISWNPLDPSFGRWGCAVTNAAMVLKFHGIVSLPNGLGTTPGNLNSWLKSIPKGYVENGKLNWESIATATKLTNLTHPLWPKLEIKKVNGSLASLRSEIQAGKPAIVQVNSGHFVTAYKVNSPTDIDIADPFFPKTKLSQYGNSFVSMRTLTPSHTDFGNFSLYMGTENSMSLERKKGSIYQTVTEAGTFTEELWGQPGNIPSGPASKILDYNKPLDGSYRIKITRNSPGLSPYTLLISDKNGNNSDTTGKLLIGSGPIYLYFEYTKSGSENSIRIEKKVTFDLLEGEILAAKKSGQLKKRYGADDLLALIRTSEQLYKRNYFASKFTFDLFQSLFQNRKGYFPEEIFKMIESDIKIAREQLF